MGLWLFFPLCKTVQGLNFGTMFIQTKLLWELVFPSVVLRVSVGFTSCPDCSVGKKKSYSVFRRICCIIHHIPTATSLASPLGSIVWCRPRPSVPSASFYSSSQQRCGMRAAHLLTESNPYFWICLNFCYLLLLKQKGTGGQETKGVWQTNWTVWIFRVDIF